MIANRFSIYFLSSLCNFPFSTSLSYFNTVDSFLYLLVDIKKWVLLAHLRRKHHEIYKLYEDSSLKLFVFISKNVWHQIEYLFQSMSFHVLSQRIKEQYFKALMRKTLSSLFEQLLLKYTEMSRVNFKFLNLLDSNKN